MAQLQKKSVVIAVLGLLFGAGLLIASSKPKTLPVSTANIPPAPTPTPTPPPAVMMNVGPNGANAGGTQYNTQ